MQHSWVSSIHSFQNRESGTINSWKSLNKKQPPLSTRKQKQLRLHLISSFFFYFQKKFIFFPYKQEACRFTITRTSDSVKHHVSLARYSIHRTLYWNFVNFPFNIFFNAMPASSQCVEQTWWHENIESLRVNKTHARFEGCDQSRTKKQSQQSPKMLQTVML